MQRISSAALLLALFSGNLHSDASPLVLSEGDFHGASPKFFRVGYGVGGTIGTPSTGGNPGRFLNPAVDISFAPLSPGHWTLVAFTFEAGHFAPGGKGIASVDFAQDIKLISGANIGTETGLCVLQGGTVFVNRWPLDDDGDWVTRSRTRLTASDFVAVNPSIDDEGFDETQSPDFSKAGSSIQFGIYSRYAHFAVDDSSYGVDNWRVKVNFIPEPASTTLAIAIIPLVALRRRK